MKFTVLSNNSEEHKGKKVHLNLKMTCKRDVSIIKPQKLKRDKQN